MQHLISFIGTLVELVVVTFDCPEMTNSILHKFDLILHFYEHHHPRVTLKYGAPDYVEVRGVETRKTTLC